jgi:hypothetical protein
MYTHSIVYTRSSGPCVGLPSSLFAHQGSIPWQLGVEVTSTSAAVSCHAMSTGLPYAHNPTTLATYIPQVREARNLDDNAYVPSAFLPRQSAVVVQAANRFKKRKGSEGSAHSLPA